MVGLCGERKSVVLAGSRMLLGFDLGRSVPLVRSKWLDNASDICELAVSLLPFSKASCSLKPLWTPESAGLTESSSSSSVRVG